MDRPLDEEWRNYELYEKVRARSNRRRLFLITIAGLGFLGLCSVPVFEERMPKWRSLGAAQRISLEIEHLKTTAIQEMKPVRIRFEADGKFIVEQVNSCTT